MIILSIGYWVWVVACVVALVQGVLLSLQTWEHRRFARRRIKEPWPVPQTTRVALLSPCKGLDLELESNLRHLLHQDYENYEVIFIVESGDDPALPVIEQLIRQASRVPVRVIISGRATATGQKIHNLMVATSQLNPEVGILAFVDSDVCPAPEWLGNLVSRLYRNDSGAMTGYRWFVPTRSTLSNCLLYSVNASIAALMGSGRQHVVWGGSWAIRRADFDAIGIRERWPGTISDDLVATVAIQEASLPIEFEPSCMTASPVDYSPAGLASFLRRQHQIGRLYAPRIWYQSLLLMIVSSAAVAGAFIVIGYGLVAGENWSRWPGGFLLAWYALQAFRGSLRRDLARLYVSKWTGPLAWAAWFDVWGSPLTLLYNTVVMCGACFGSRITWRGVIYDLDRQGRLLRVLQTAPGPAPADRRLRFDPADAGQRTVERSRVDVPAKSQNHISGTDT